MSEEIELPPSNGHCDTVANSNGTNHVTIPGSVVEKKTNGGVGNDVGHTVQQNSVASHPTSAAIPKPPTATITPQPGNKTTKLQSLFTVFRFASIFDWFLMILGTVAALVHGAALPVAMFYFGHLTNVFVNQFTSKQLVNTEFSFDPKKLVEDLAGRLIIVDPDIILSGFINFTNITGGLVNCSEDYVLLPPAVNFDQALQIGVTEIAKCLEDGPFIEAVNRYVIGFVCIAAIVLVAGTVQISMFQISSDNQVHCIKLRFYRSILRQETAWFDSHSSGELSSRLSDDIEKIHEGIGDKLAIFIQWSTTFVVGFIIGFIREWRLTLLLLGITPFIAIAVATSSFLIISLTSREQERLGRASAIVEEVLSSIRTVVAFGGENVESKRYNESLQKVKSTENVRGLTSGVSLGIIYFLIFTCYAIGFWFSAWLLSEELIQAGDVLTVFFAVLIGAFSLGQAVPYFQKLVTAAGASIPIYDIIDRKPVIDSTCGSLPITNNDGSIEFRNVNFSYPTRPDVQVLKDFSLKVEPGKTVALVGPSGSGKSTAIQLLLRFYDTSVGQILVGGNDAKSLDINWLRSNIGLVGQEPVLFDTTVATNISFGKEGATLEEIVQAARDANADGFVSEMPEGYNTQVGNQGAQMSGGQKQRIAIARALIRNPRILLLDDATSALDSDSESIVQAALDRAREGRTTIIISHRLSTIQSADVIAYIEGGSIVEMGSHDELMERKGAYYGLVTTQYATVDEAEQATKEEVDSTETQPQTDEKQHPEKRRSFKQSFKKSPQDETIASESPEREPSVSWFRILTTNHPKLLVLFLIGLLGAIVQGTIFPMFAYFFGQVLRVFTLPFNQVLGAVHVWAGTFLILGVASGLATFVKNIFLTLFGSHLTSNLRTRTFKSILGQEIGWFDSKKNSTGALTARLANANQIQWAVGVEFGTLLETVTSIVVALVLSFAVDWLLTLVVAGYIPLEIFAALFQLLILSLHTSQYKRSSEEGIKVAVDSVNNHQTVHALSAEDKFFEMYRTTIQKSNRYSVLAGITYGIAYGFAQALIFLGYAVTFRFGAWQSVQPINDRFFARFEHIYTVFMALIFGSLALGQANSFAPSYIKAKIAAKKIFALLDRRSQIDSYSKEGLNHENASGSVKLHDVYFSYPNRPSVRVMNGMTLAVPTGQTVALVGPSGYGKSTIVSLLQRFYDPQRGSIQIDGTTLGELNVRWLRNQIGLVSQEPVLFDRSIADNIRYGANFEEVSEEQIIQAAQDANIHSFIQSLPQGYNTIVGEKGALLSRGQKQCVAIARALIRNPKLLLLDEATSALDSESERIVQDALDRATQNRTSIVIAHRLSTITNADTIAVIHRGRVVELGSHSELIGMRGVYHKMYTYQAGTPHHINN